MLELTVSSPLGPLTLRETRGAITALRWGATGVMDTDSALLRAAADQLDAYFSRNLKEFDLSLDVKASLTQRRACAAMSAIPFGETRTYGALSKEMGLSAQAMGQLCGGNPIPILIPCHRVLGATSLGGFSGGRGIEDKVWLLRHEGAAGLLI